MPIGHKSTVEHYTSLSVQESDKGFQDGESEAHSHTTGCVQRNAGFNCWTGSTPGRSTGMMPATVWTARWSTKKQDDHWLVAKHVPGWKLTSTLITMQANCRTQCASICDGHLQKFRTIGNRSSTREHSAVFRDKTGEMEGDYHIRINESVTPVRDPPWQVPVALREKVKLKLRGGTNTVDKFHGWSC